MKKEKYALYVGGDIPGWIYIGTEPDEDNPTLATTYASHTYLNRATLFDTTDEAHAAAEQAELTMYTIQTVYVR